MTIIDPETLVIDPEFEAICRPHSDEEKAEFRRSIEKDGYRDALVAWFNGDLDYLILDGHHRFRHWRAYDEDDPDRRPPVKLIDLPDRAAAIVWIVRNQLARRNLTAAERVALAKRLEPAIREQAKQQQGERTDILTNLSESQPVNTRKEVAKAAGVSEGTVENYDTVMQSEHDDLKAAVNSGEKSIGGAANEVKQRRQAALSQPEMPAVQDAWQTELAELLEQIKTLGKARKVNRQRLQEAVKQICELFLESAE